MRHSHLNSRDLNTKKGRKTFLSLLLILLQFRYGYLHGFILKLSGDAVVQWLVRWTSELKVSGSTPSPCHRVVSLDKKLY